MKQIRISNDNEKELKAIVRDSGNSLLTMPRAANIAIAKGIPALRRKFANHAKSQK